MNVEQRAVRFACSGEMLYGVITLPARPAGRGVLVVVGGPQYRAGSHRQFVLLARFLAAHGTPVMRFDVRGMGDSEGESRTFEDVDDDIRCAIDQFHEEVPELREVVIWGLCDAASAALFYAHRDPRVAGLVLLNPWARTEQGAATAYLKHYYLKRLASRDFWTKVVRFRFDAAGSVRSLVHLARTATSGKTHAAARSDNQEHAAPLPDRMLSGLQRFRGPVLFILSGNDLTAREFMDCTGASAEWRTQLASKRVRIYHLPDANHTFARSDWRDDVAALTCDWIMSW